MMRKLAIFVLILLTFALAKIMAQTTGTATLSVTPALGNKSLIPGCIVTLIAGVQTPSCASSKWTVQGFRTAPAAVQGFEKGSAMPAGQAIAGTTHIECTFAHGGGCAATAHIAANGAADQWFFSPNQLVGREFYLSYWDYGQGASFNEEYVLCHIIKFGLGPPTNMEEVGFTLFRVTQYPGPGSGTLLNDPNAQMQNGPQDNYNGACIPNCTNPTYAFYGPTVTNYGSTGWNQWEIWYRGNTVTGGVGNHDGFERIYRNGSVYMDLEGIDMTGPYDMSGMSVQAGGWYTKNIWKHKDGSCAAAAANGDSTEMGACGDFTNCACPPNGPIFDRYIDDIILLEK
jgi:hypothetical protein